jgi:pyruvate,orthophosphate dikinase
VQAFLELMRWADQKRTLRVRANADQPDQCRTAVAFGAEGVGLCRTEHMFFGEGRIDLVRAMILAGSAEDREKALAKLLPLQRADFEGIFKAMRGHPVTVRTLDPPLHEFLRTTTRRSRLARHGCRGSGLSARRWKLKEQNPMLGHRGCRLGISHRNHADTGASDLRAACDVAKASGKAPEVEIMIPLVGTKRELDLQERIVDGGGECSPRGLRGAVPGGDDDRAAARGVARRKSRTAEFFVGTNDLTLRPSGSTATTASSCRCTWRRRSSPTTRSRRWTGRESGG